LAAKFYTMFRSFLLLLILMACSTPATKPNDVLLQDTLKADGIPTSASREEFTDARGMIRASLSENDGSKSADGTFVNERKEGAWTEYYPNGLVKNITSYVNGEKEGIYMELSNTGQLTKRYYHHKGLRHGEYKEFYYSQLKEERTYRFGKIEGVVKIYYDNAKLMEESNYQNGIRDGISKWYDQDGNLSIQYEYRNGELIKK
jgi:antitoxin component YwqK of YwqJK toxin-antitoxin module